MTSYDGQSITYDTIGNPLSYYNGQRYTKTWSNGRQLDSTNVGGMNLSYSYNADGQRTSKSRSAYYTDEYVYYGTQLSTLIRNGVGYKHSLTFIYDDNGQALGFYYDTNLNDSNPGTKYYYVCNAQGDVLQLRDHTNVPVANYYYDTWGKLLGITDANGNAITAFNSVAVLNPIRYRGYFYDTETGFYYVSSRYYDPEIGRWINADVMLDTETVLGFNLFAYCGNNPIMYVDPTGYGRTYVIYYNNPGSGFYDQAMNSPYYNRKSKNVYMISVTSNQDFIDAWNSMSGTIDYVYLYLHGGKGVLYFKGESLSFSGKQSFSSLNSKKVKKGVYLFSCKGGAGGEGNNVAWMIAKLTSSKVYACTGSVSYSKIFGKYYARKAWDWGIIKTFYYQKRYIFWGANIAKSVAGQW